MMVRGSYTVKSHWAVQHFTLLFWEITLNNVNLLSLFTKKIQLTETTCKLDLGGINIKMISARFAELPVIIFKTSHDYLCLFDVFSKPSNTGHHWCIRATDKIRNYDVTTREESHSMTMKAFKHWKTQVHTYYLPWVARWDSIYSFSPAVGFQLESSFFHWLHQKSSHCWGLLNVKLEKRRSILLSFLVPSRSAWFGALF